MRTRQRALRHGLAAMVLLGLAPLAQAATLTVERGVSTVESGIAVQATLTLDDRAGTDMVVPLATSNSGVVAVPTSLKIPAGASAGSFTIKIGRVSVDTVVTITATPAGPRGPIPIEAGLKIAPPPGLASASLSPGTVTGGGASTLSITLQRAALYPGAVLTIGTSAATVASAPTTVTIEPGKKSASVNVTTQPVASLATATLTARNAAGETASATLTINPPVVQIASLTAPAFMTAATDDTIHVVLDPPPPGTVTGQLSSSNPAALSVYPAFSFNPSLPPNVVGRIAVEPKVVAVDTPVTVTATLGSSSRTVNVTVRPLLVTLSTPSDTVIGGSTTVGTLAFNLARNRETVIALSASGTAPVICPSSVTVQGRSLGSNPASVNFDIVTQATTSARSATITATLPAEIGGGTRIITIAVQPVQIAALQLDRTGCDLSLDCPATVAGTVTLNGPAPAAGIVVSLSSSRTDHLTVPTTVLIPAGATSAAFSATRQSGARFGVVTITATAPSAAARTATFAFVQTFLGVASITVDSNTVTGGTNITGTVTAEQFVQANPAGSPVKTPVSPTQFDVPIAVSINGLQGIASPVVNRVVPRGQSSATFSITPPAVASTTAVEVRAATSLPVGLSSGTTRIAPVTLQPAAFVAVDLPVTETQGGFTVDGTIRMSGAVPFSNSVTLTSSDPNVTIQGSPTFLVGATTGTFRLSTSANVTTPVTATLTASFAGQSMSRNLTVLRRSVLSSAHFPAVRLIGALPTTLTIELNGPAPAGGATIALASQQVAAVPASVVIPAGQTTATVPMTVGNPPNDSAPVLVSVSYGGDNLVASVTVERLQFSVEPLFPTISGGGNFTATLSMLNNGLTAPAGGIQFTIVNSTPSLLSVPATVTIPAGQTSVAVQIQAQPVAAPSTVALSIQCPNQAFSYQVKLAP